jgi:hypothetical protein
MSIDIKNCQYINFLQYIEKISITINDFEDIMGLLNEQYMEIAEEIHKKNDERIIVLDKIKLLQQEFKKIQKVEPLAVNNEEIITNFNDKVNEQKNDNNDIIPVKKSKVAKAVKSKKDTPVEDKAISKIDIIQDNEEKITEQLTDLENDNIKQEIITVEKESTKPKKKAGVKKSSLKDTTNGELIAEPVPESEPVSEIKTKPKSRTTKKK